ncbi:hypothetical protein [Microbulbifer epialgicus]|uniref:Peptidase M41 domain-containing protein n=1 Tax=Microbulbifer epialgicus TaxID=393907 RepID=A0ABV4NTS3_9GAMM
MKALRSLLTFMDLSIPKRLILSLLPLFLLFWCSSRILTSPSSKTLWDVINPIAAIGCWILYLLLFIKTFQHRRWDIIVTRRIIETSLFLLILGSLWPYLSNLFIYLIGLDGESKAVIFMLGTLAYAAHCLWKLISKLNQKPQALVLHKLFAGSVKKSASTVRTKRIVASHEAGHVMLFSCLSNIPHNVSVSIKEEDKSLGRVTSQIMNETIPSDLLEWKMLLCLAGRAAELYRYQKYSIGSENDLSKWEALADLYLSNGMGAFYYINTNSEEKWNHNLKVLYELRLELELKLAEFFKNNEEVLSAIENSLLKDTKLHGTKLKELLDRVVITRDMPCPKEMK